MLNIHFFYIYLYAPQIILFFYFVFVFIVNYSFYINFFFTKKRSAEVVNLDLFTLSFILVVVNFIYCSMKYSTVLHLSPIYFLFFKYIYFLFFILSLLTVVVLYLFKYYYNNSNTLNYNMYVAPSFLILFYFATTCNNFFFLFFFLELFGYIFYLQFMQTFNKIKTKKINNFYFDSLLLYYWSNFFGSILILYSVVFILYSFNTTNFFELVYFVNSRELNLFYFVWFLGFSLKMGLPGLHFFKLEIYKNLKLDSVINFSFFSLFGYLILLKLIFFKFNILAGFSVFILFFIIFFILFVMTTSLKSTNLISFFGYSTILNSVIMLFLVV